jgi:hypothetical protein
MLRTRILTLGSKTPKKRPASEIATATALQSLQVDFQRLTMENEQLRKNQAVPEEDEEEYDDDALIGEPAQKRTKRNRAAGAEDRDGYDKKG